MSQIFINSPLTKPVIYDSHAHYDDAKFDGIRDELLSELPKHGVGAVITCGCDAESSSDALSLAEKYDYIYAAVGIHPENLESKTTISKIYKLARHKKCVAIGEIGLDYYWISDNKEKQKKVFSEQLELANRLDMPVIVHDRDAHEDTLKLLEKYRPKGVVHSFSGSPEMAKQILKTGMYIGIGGVVTFKNAKKLPEVVEALPQDRILLETDAPYLTPVPFRSETNNSAMIYYTAKKIAEIRNCSIDDVFDFSIKNFKKLFSI